jgi:membrane-bound lytic murein transglycosylase D
MVPAVSVVSEAQPEIKPEPVAEALTVKEDEAVAVIDSVATTPDVTAPDTVKIVAAPQVSRKMVHTVQAGETLYSIARMYQIGVMDLVNWNDLDLQQGIKPGQNLKLAENQPVKKDPSPLKTQREVVHEVKSSDTLYSIARQYGVTIKELMDWNKKKDFSLAVGEKLKIH